MDALVDQRGPAVELGAAAPVGGGVVLGRPVPLDARRRQQHASEAALGDEVAQPNQLRLQSILEQHAEPDARALGRGHERLALRERDVDRLLHQHVQRLLRGGDSLVGVQRRRAADHHQVHRPVRQELVVAGERAAAEARGERLGLGQVAAVEGGDAEPRLERRARVRVGDVAAADETRLERHFLPSGRSPRPPAPRARGRRDPGARAAGGGSWPWRPGRGVKSSVSLPPLNAAWPSGLAAKRP